MAGPTESKVGVSDNAGGAQIETVEFSEGGTQKHRQVIEQGEWTKRIDDTTTANMTYIGKARPGTATSVAEWQVKRIDESGANIVILFADGDEIFNNIWDDRASLSYS